MRVRTSVIAVALALMSGETLAQALQPGWIADARSGCRAWNSTPQANEEISWDGPCQNGLGNGRGQLQWIINGQITLSFEGELRDGRMNGYGVLTRADGTKYIGELHDGVAEGGGVLVKPDGVTASGIWIDGCISDGQQVASVGRDLELARTRRGNAKPTTDPAAPQMTTRDARGRFCPAPKLRSMRARGADGLGAL